MSANGGRIEFLIGRFVSGMGSGAVSVVGTSCMAKIAPRAIRGGLMALYNANTMLSVGLGYWVNYGAIQHISSSSQAQWQVPMGIQALSRLICIVGLLVIPESPRWLVYHGKYEEVKLALENFRSLPRDHEYVSQEYNEIKAPIDLEQSLAPGWKSFLAEITSPGIRKRLFMVMMMQVGFQFSGGNIIYYYNTSILESIGLKSQSTNYLFSGVYGLVKLVAVCSYCLFIARFGRRTGLFIGSGMIILSLTYITAYLGVSETHETSGAAGWVAVAFIYIFAVGYAFSWGTVPWIINAEVFPTHVRSTSMSICVAWQYRVGKASLFVAAAQEDPNPVGKGDACIKRHKTISITVIYGKNRRTSTRGACNGMAWRNQGKVQ